MANVVAFIVSGAAASGAVVHRATESNINIFGVCLLGVLFFFLGGVTSWSIVDIYQKIKKQIGDKKHKKSFE